jgi:xylulokinase
MSADVWWAEFVSIATELTDQDVEVVAVGVSGMGPCLLLTDDADVPVRSEPVHPSL